MPRGAPPVQTFHVAATFVDYSYVTAATSSKEYRACVVQVPYRYTTVHVLLFYIHIIHASNE